MKNIQDYKAGRYIERVREVGVDPAIDEEDAGKRKTLDKVLKGRKCVLASVISVAVPISIYTGIKYLKSQ